VLFIVFVRRTFPILTSLVCLSVLLGGAPRLWADDLQSWHRLSLSVWQKDRWEAQFSAEGRWMEDSTRLHEYLFTPQITWQANEHLQAGMAYTLLGVRDATGFNNDHRLELELNPHWELTDWVRLDLRNRLEVRFREGPGNGTERTRHRLQLSFPLHHTGALKSLFVNNEAFLDLDRHQYNQNRLTPLGLSFRLNEHTQMRIFYMLQSTRIRADWDHAHALGTHLQFQLR